MRDDLPTVQIPLGADRAGLSIDGDFTPLWDLPEEARDLYTRYARQGGNIRIWQCQDCGYLTDADALRRSTYESYECGGCGRKTSSPGLQRKGRADFLQVHGPLVDRDDDRFVDVLALESAKNCEHPDVDVEQGGPELDRGRSVSPIAIECDRCVPNHPSHLGRLQNQLEGEVTRSELLEGVAEIVRDFREA